MNKLEMNLCQALDENEEMRRRLGLEPSENIDLSGTYYLLKCLVYSFTMFKLFLKTSSLICRVKIYEGRRTRTTPGREPTTDSRG